MKACAYDYSYRRLMKYILVDNSQEQGHQDVKPEREWLIQPELFSFLIKAVPGVGD